MVLKEYSSKFIPIFVTLGSMGVLYPYLVEGFIIFSFILLIALYSLGRLFDKINVRGYYDILLASITVIFAFSYFQKFSIIFIITGILVFAFALYTIFIAMQEIKCAC